MTRKKVELFHVKNYTKKLSNIVPPRYMVPCAVWRIYYACYVIMLFPMYVNILIKCNKKMATIRIKFYIIKCL